MGNAKQPAREQNIQAITGFYASGIKDEASRIGIELEHTLSQRDGSQLSYQGACELLRAFEGDFPQPMVDGGHLIGAAGKGKTITLEPASQVELSAGPFTGLADARDCLGSFEEQLRGYCERNGLMLRTPGYNLDHKAIDLELIPKERYAIMNEYLGAISMFGVCMMRGSAATQVAIDYTSTEDCLRKLRLANACVPIFSLMCDNSPIFEAAPRRHQLVRTEIWERCDPDRCGTVPGVMSPSFTLEDYAAYVLDTPACVERTPHGDILSSRTFGEIFAERPMERTDVEHALSMLFNDVRLKTYVEIRPADAMPAECVVAYAALIRGLFYGRGALDAMEAIFAGVTEEAISAAKQALMAGGYQAAVYGSPVSEIADELVSIAASALDEEERPFLEPLAELVAGRITLADRAEGAFGR